VSPNFRFVLTRDSYAGASPIFVMRCKELAGRAADIRPQQAALAQSCSGDNMLPKKITTERKQEFVHSSESQHWNEPAGLKPPQIRSQITPQSLQPPSPLALDTHAGLNARAPTPGTPPAQTRALLGAGNTRPLGSQPAVRPLSKRLVKTIDAFSGDTKGKTQSPVSAIEHKRLTGSDDELAPLNIDWFVLAGQTEGVAGEACTPRSKAEDHDAKGSGVKPDAPASTRNAKVLSKPFSAFNKEKGRRQQKNADQHSILWKNPEAPVGSNEFFNWACKHPIQSLFNQVYPMTEMANRSSKNGGFYPMHAVLAGDVLDETAYFDNLVDVVQKWAIDESRLVGFYGEADSIRKQTSGIMREQAHFFARFFEVLIQLRALHKEGNTSPGSYRHARDIVEELRQEWLRTDFDYFLDKQLNTEPGLGPVESDTGDAGLPKKPKLTHKRREAEKTEEQKPHRTHGGARKQDVFPGSNSISRKSNLLNKENLLADPDFPPMPNLEMAVSQYQFSSLSSESSVGRIGRAQWLLPSAASPSASRAAHTGSARATRRPDQPGANGEIPQGAAHGLKRKWGSRIPETPGFILPGREAYTAQDMRRAGQAPTIQPSSASKSGKPYRASRRCQAQAASTPHKAASSRSPLPSSTSAPRKAPGASRMRQRCSPLSSAATMRSRASRRAAVCLAGWSFL
jgi:hypothetical protein